MKRLKRFAALILSIIMLSGMANALTWEDFPQDHGHWASETLEKAVSDGLLEGNESGLDPDGTLTAAEMVTILCRVLGAEEKAELSAYDDIRETDWYYEQAAYALAMGIIEPENDKLGMTEAVTREMAFLSYARAFQTVTADTDLSLLEDYSDSGLLSKKGSAAAASLIEAGVIQGSYGALNPEKYITRAEFVTMLYRIVGGYSNRSSPQAIDDGALVLSAKEVTLSSEMSGDVIFDAGVRGITFQGFTTDHRAVVRSDKLEWLTFAGGSGIDTLVLANMKGDLTLYSAGRAGIGRLVAGLGGGRLTLQCDTGIIDVMSDGREIEVLSRGVETVNICGDGNTVKLTAMPKNLNISGSGNKVKLAGGVTESLIVSGEKNDISIGCAAEVSVVELTQGAGNTKLAIDGRVESVTITGAGSSVTGNGKAGSVTVRTADYRLDVAFDGFTDEIDPGLRAVEVGITVQELKAGDSIKAEAVFTSPDGPKYCSYEWLLDGEVAASGNLEVADGGALGFERDVIYSRDMELDRRLELRLTYKNQGTRLVETLSTEETVRLQNYSDTYYNERDTERILALISNVYSGDYTLEYAENNDYEDFEKEIWINAKGHTSSTGYLLWINRAYQRVNIFEMTQGEWKLIRTCLVGTGAEYSQTPMGVTHVTYKNWNGWLTDTYLCKPVVGFYPGTGYAFHSRLYNTNGVGWSDSRIGFPVSHGCIRMYDEDILWIYDSIPINTAVVIF